MKYGYVFRMCSLSRLAEQGGECRTALARHHYPSAAEARMDMREDATEEQGDVSAKTTAGLEASSLLHIHN